MQSEMRAKYDRSKIDKDVDVTIPFENLEITCCRSSGPGGQNVNKVATKVEIRIDLNDCYWIPDKVMERLKEREKNRINKLNEFILVCDTHRTQYDNRNEANARLQEIIENCCYPERERIESEMPMEYKELQKEEKKKKKQSKNLKKDMKSRGW